MPTETDIALDRIADSLKDIALAFLGPQLAFVEVNGPQLEAIVKTVLQTIWAPVKTQLAIVPAPSLAGALAVPMSVLGSTPLALPSSNRVKSSEIVFGKEFKEFKARETAKFEVNDLEDRIDEEMENANKILDKDPSKFAPDVALETYLEFARGTENAANQIQGRLRGVRGFLFQHKINADVDNDFKSIKDALPPLEETNVEGALKPKAPDESAPVLPSPGAADPPAGIRDSVSSATNKGRK